MHILYLPKKVLNDLPQIYRVMDVNTHTTHSEYLGQLEK